jgi:hypothetical protein
MEALAVADRVLPAVFFTDTDYVRMSAEAKVALLLLTSLADKDGIAPCPEEILVPHTKFVPTNKVLAELEVEGHLTIYNGPRGNRWAWLPWVAEHQPCRGNMRLSRDPSRPPPPSDLVARVLAKRLRREPTKKEMRGASPRTFGLKRSSVVANGPVVAGDGKVVAEDVHYVGVKDIFNAWRSYQKRPESCHCGPATKRMIESALKEAVAQDLCDLIEYAYTADEPGPRFWRGENQNKRTYLGLDNLMRTSKIASRVQMLQDWRDTRAVSGATDGDGTNMGPLAAYRRSGPSGTISTPTPRPQRLSEQCERILALFRQRGGQGVRTAELAEIALKYTGRISEIRGAGHDVVVSERRKDGNNLYVLHDQHQAGGSGGVD